MQKWACDQNNSCGSTLPVFAGIFALQHQLLSICNGKIKVVFLTIRLYFDGKKTNGKRYFCVFSNVLVPVAITTKPLSQLFIYRMYVAIHKKTYSKAQILDVSEKKNASVLHFPLFPLFGIIQLKLAFVCFLNSTSIDLFK